MCLLPGWSPVSCAAGEINFTEFLQAIALCLKGTSEQKINTLFHIMDLDGDGACVASVHVPVCVSTSRAGAHLHHALFGRDLYGVCCYRSGHQGGDGEVLGEHARHDRHAKTSRRDRGTGGVLFPGCSTRPMPRALMCGVGFPSCRVERSAKRATVAGSGDVDSARVHSPSSPLALPVHRDIRGR